jgi:excisionase family DNA binding protein
VTRPRLFHSVAETAELCGLGVMSVYRAIKENRFPAVKVGGRLLGPDAALHRMAHDAMAANGIVDAADYVASEVA